MLAMDHDHDNSVELVRDGDGSESLDLLGAVSCSPTEQEVLDMLDAVSNGPHSSVTTPRASQRTPGADVSVAYQLHGGDHSSSTTDRSTAALAGVHVPVTPTGLLSTMHMDLIMGTSMDNGPGQGLQQHIRTNRIGTTCHDLMAQITTLVSENDELHVENQALRGQLYSSTTGDHDEASQMKNACGFKHLKDVKCVHLGEMGDSAAAAGGLHSAFVGIPSPVQTPRALLHRDHAAGAEEMGAAAGDSSSSGGKPLAPADEILLLKEKISALERENFALTTSFTGYIETMDAWQKAHSISGGSSTSGSSNPGTLSNSARSNGSEYASSDAGGAAGGGNGGGNGLSPSSVGPPRRGRPGVTTSTSGKNTKTIEKAMVKKEKIDQKLEAMADKGKDELESGRNKKTPPKKAPSKSGRMKKTSSKKVAEVNREQRDPEPAERRNGLVDEYDGSSVYGDALEEQNHKDEDSSHDVGKDEGSWVDVPPGLDANENRADLSPARSASGSRTPPPPMGAPPPAPAAGQPTAAQGSGLILPITKFTPARDHSETNGSATTSAGTPAQAPALTPSQQQRQQQQHQQAAQFQAQQNHLQLQNQLKNSFYQEQMMNNSLSASAAWKNANGSSSSQQTGGRGSGICWAALSAQEEHQSSAASLVAASKASCSATTAAGTTTAQTMLRNGSPHRLPAFGGGMGSAPPTSVMESPGLQAASQPGSGQEGMTTQQMMSKLGVTSNMGMGSSSSTSAGASQVGANNVSSAIRGPMAGTNQQLMGAGNMLQASRMMGASKIGAQQHAATTMFQQHHSGSTMGAHQQQQLLAGAQTTAGGMMMGGQQVGQLGGQHQQGSSSYLSPQEQQALMQQRLQQQQQMNQMHLQQQMNQHQMGANNGSNGAGAYNHLGGNSMGPGAAMGSMGMGSAAHQQMQKGMHQGNRNQMGAAGGQQQLAAQHGHGHQMQMGGNNPYHGMGDQQQYGHNPAAGTQSGQLHAGHQQFASTTNQQDQNGAVGHLTGDMQDPEHVRQSLAEVCRRYDVEKRTTDWFLEPQFSAYWPAMLLKCSELDRRNEDGSKRVKNASAWLTKFFNILRSDPDEPRSRPLGTVTASATITSSASSG
eukprot:g8597.t1